jgi:hypothetical protein
MVLIPIICCNTAAFYCYIKDKKEIAEVIGAQCLVNDLTLSVISCGIDCKSFSLYPITLFSLQDHMA